MKVYSLTDSELTENINAAKEIFLKALVNERVITQKQCDKALEEYAIVISPPNFFGRIISKLAGQDKEAQFRIVRMADLGKYVPQPKPETMDDKSKVVSIFKDQNEPVKE